jgi:hypothetical protein
LLGELGKTADIPPIFFGASNSGWLGVSTVVGELTSADFEVVSADADSTGAALRVIPLKPLMFVSPLNLTVHF